MAVPNKQIGTASSTENQLLSNISKQIDRLTQVISTSGGGGGGSVNSVSGTINRITSTGGTDPIIDISATFEGLLGKVAQPLSQFAATTSAQLASIISDETGTGSLVFSNSPVFTTPNIGNATGNISGSAATWTTGRTIGITGDVIYTSPVINGSANVTAAATVTRINGTSLAGLATGLLKNTTGTGVPTIAVAGTDYLSPTGSGSSLTGVWLLASGGTLTGDNTIAAGGNTLAFSNARLYTYAQASQSTTHTFVSYTQAAHTGGSPTGFLYTGGSSTTLTASTESIDVNINLARTVQFNTGTIATQRAFLIQAPTYAFVAASSITDATTVAITGAPILGTNASFNRSYALWVQSGNVRVDGNITKRGGSFSIFTEDAQALIISTNSTTRTTWGASGQQTHTVGSLTGTWITYTQGANTSAGSTAQGLLWTAGAHTLQLASTELTDINFNLARTITFQAGAITNQRAFRIQNPTYGFAATSTITTAATVAITGAPVAGTNATITNSYALLIEAGATRLNGNFGVNVAPVAQQSVNTILVNNVTSGGSLSTIANYTDLAIYANDAATIRNNFFRLTEKVLALETALRNYGLVIN